MALVGPRRALLGTSAAWAIAGSSFDLDLMHGRAAINGQSVALSSVLSWTNASQTYAQNASGVWVLIAANTPRISDQGSLIEQSSTNSLRNNSMQGAVAGTPGTLPTNWVSSLNGTVALNVIGAGTEFGLPYIDLQFVGTPTGSSVNIAQDSYTAISAANGQTWSASAFIRVVAGDYTNISSVNFQLDECNGGAPLAATNIAVANSAAFTRLTGTRTFNQASTSATNTRITLGTTNGSAINVTFRIYAPQLEQLGFVTSPILTTSAAVTRSADNVTLSGAATTAAQAATAMRLETGLIPSAASAPILMQFNGGSSFEYASASSVVAADGTHSATASFGSGTTAGVVKSAYGLDNTSMTAIANGGTKVTQGTSVWATHATGTVFIGQGKTNANVLNGYLRRLTLGNVKGMFDGLTV